MRCNMTVLENRWRTLCVAVVATILVLTAPARILAQSAPAVVVPSTGLYSALSAQWWQWILGIPVGANPGLDDGSDQTGRACAVNQSGPVWFLAGTFTGGPVTRVCNVPAGRALFFPLVNTTYI